jgi:hypothetical protein
MIDVELIKTSYSQMADEQLIFLARNESASISQEAFIVLKRELRKRNLSAEIITEAEKTREAKHREKIINNLEQEFSKATNKLWNEIFEMKAQGRSNLEIKEFLLNEGLTYENAELYIGEMKMVAEENLKRNNRHIQKTVYGFLLAALILVWNYFSFFSITAVIVGVFISLSSAAAWAKLDAFRNKLKAALKEIDKG